MALFDDLVESGLIKRFGGAIASGAENLLSKVGNVISDPTKEFIVREGSSLGKILLQRKFQGQPLGPAAQNQLLTKTATYIRKGGAYIYGKSPLPGYVQGANAQIGELAFALKRKIVLQRGTQVATDAAGNLLLDEAGRPVTIEATKLQAAVDRVRTAYFSNYGPTRFARTTANRFVFDYASIQLVNLAQQAVEEIFPSLGPTKGNDGFDLTPFDQYNSSVLPHDPNDPNAKQKEKSDKRKQYLKQLINIVIYQVLSSTVNQGLNRFRSGQVSLYGVTKSSSTQYGQRLAQNTEMALRYYGNRKPEVAGNILGNVLASAALGANPKQIVSSLGARGIINAGVGFYNVSKPTQQRLPTMGPGYRTRIKQMNPNKAAKRIEGTIKKVRQVHRVSQTRREQGKLF